jgi:membrane protease YdiL (CAAX protease family)
MVLAPVLSMAAAAAGSMAFPSSGVVAVLLSATALYSTLLGVCALVSHRHGSGSISKDLGLAFERGDILAGVGYAIVARVGVLIVSIALYVIYRPLARGNLEGEDLRSDVAASIALAVLAVTVAPICEELFFRGLLLHALNSVTSHRSAMGLQAVLFGLMHAGAYGLGNVGVVASTAVVGLLLAHVADRQGRLGAAVLTHAMHNAASLLLLLALTP